MATDSDGKLSGLFGRIAECTEYEYVSIEYVGQIVDGQVDTESNDAQTWIGAHESYRFIEIDGVTTVDVELGGDDVGDDFADMFGGAWPKSLVKLKEITEK